MSRYTGYGRSGLFRSVVQQMIFPQNSGWTWIKTITFSWLSETRRRQFQMIQFAPKPLFPPKNENVLCLQQTFSALKIFTNQIGSNFTSYFCAFPKQLPLILWFCAFPKQQPATLWWDWNCELLYWKLLGLKLVVIKTFCLVFLYIRVKCVRNVYFSPVKMYSFTEYFCMNILQKNVRKKLQKICPIEIKLLHISSIKHLCCLFSRTFWRWERILTRLRLCYSVEALPSCRPGRANLRT